MPALYNARRGGGGRGRSRFGRLIMYYESAGGWDDPALWGCIDWTCVVGKGQVEVMLSEHFMSDRNKLGTFGICTRLTSYY